MDPSPPSFRGEAGQVPEPPMLDLPPPYANETSHQKPKEREQDPTPELTIDHQLILPREPPATGLYQLSHALDIRCAPIDLSRIRPDRRATVGSIGSSYAHDSHDQDQILYRLTRAPQLPVAPETRG